MGVYVEYLVGAVILLSNRGFGGCFMAELEAIQRYAHAKYRVRHLVFGATGAKIKGDSSYQIMGVYVECLVGAVILLSNRGFDGCFMAELEAIQRYAIAKYR
ncbi:hypothetical protein CEXT_253681 [Caerostris extrusa]|uniref:Uncharacterized protein n=1 Tax=Caerostris extrusa TaxID=172846 RepID=A0AAV4Q8U6_CAEEX|nr:hypothetical protein CEXT_253681 [Caerostris extrusa]